MDSGSKGKQLTVPRRETFTICICFNSDSLKQPHFLLYLMNLVVRTKEEKTVVGVTGSPYVNTERWVKPLQTVVLIVAKSTVKQEVLVQLE